jgi:hypothetical protein
VRRKCRGNPARGSRRTARTSRRASGTEPFLPNCTDASPPRARRSFRRPGCLGETLGFADRPRDRGAVSRGTSQGEDRRPCRGPLASPNIRRRGRSIRVPARAGGALDGATAGPNRARSAEPVAAPPFPPLPAPPACRRPCPGTVTPVPFAGHPKPEGRPRGAGVGTGSWISGAAPDSRVRHPGPPRRPWRTDRSGRWARARRSSRRRGVARTSRKDPGPLDREQRTCGSSSVFRGGPRARAAPTIAARRQPYAWPPRVSSVSNGRR